MPGAALRTRLAGAALGLVALGASPAGPDPVVVRVGAAALRVSEVERRLRAVPSYQLRTLGDDPASIRRRFVMEVLVPELRLAEGAKQRRITESPRVKARRDAALHRALQESLRAEVAAGDAAGADAIQAYYEENRRQFVTPRSLHLWRILVEDEEVARKILEETRRDGVSAWSRLAREKSLDAATRMRNGSLGFVRADGQTHLPQLRVAPALFTAADEVADGELVPEPIREAGRYSIVWRRGSRAAVERTLEQEQDAIRETLLRRAVAERVRELLESLRRQHVRDVAPEHLTALSIPERRAPAGTRPAAPARSAEPRPRADQGNR